jgi:hypothetical protein
MNLQNIPLQDIENARKIRKLRSGIKRDLKTGKISLNEAFSNTLIYNNLKEMKLIDVLSSLPKKGRIYAVNLMKEMDISKCKKIGGLGKKQRLKLFTHFGLEKQLL